MAETPTSGTLRSLALRTYRNDTRLQWALLAFMLVFYGALMRGAWGQSEQTVAWNYTFNSMLAHLMHGQFDVDPQIVGWEEGFLRNGRTYSYFGIWSALLRLPLWIIGRMDVDLVLPSCIVAACIAGMAKVRAILLVRRHAAQNPIARSAVFLMLLYVLFGGSGIGNLNASMYLEVILWAYAFASIFVYLAVKGIVNRSFTLRSLCAMALCAGLALNTRVSTGIGLILAFALLLIALTAYPFAARTPNPRDSRPTARFSPVRSFFRALAARRTLVPAGILSALMAVSGTVNYFRWGSPFTFANWDLYLNWAPSPGSLAWWLSPILAKMHAYGAFNLVRIPFNLVYYFCPFWALRDIDDGALFNSYWGRTMNGIELPPSSFFLTDLFVFCFIALLAVALWRHRKRAFSPAARSAAAVAIGLLAPCILMLTAMWVAYRYRMEFYPEFQFLAFLGLYLTVTDDKMLALFARFRKGIIAALVLSVASSFFFLFLVDVGLPMPPAYGGRPLVAYYRMVAAQHIQQIIARHFASHP
jgi:cbb3-type cytochrome oxidase subunit 3